MVMVKPNVLGSLNHHGIDGNITLQFPFVLGLTRCAHTMYLHCVTAHIILLFVVHSRN